MSHEPCAAPTRRAPYGPRRVLPRLFSPHQPAPPISPSVWIGAGFVGFSAGAAQGLWDNPRSSRGTASPVTPAAGAFHLESYNRTLKEGSPRELRLLCLSTPAPHGPLPRHTLAPSWVGTPALSGPLQGRYPGILWPQCRCWRARAAGAPVALGAPAIQPATSPLDPRHSSAPVGLGQYQTFRGHDRLTNYIFALQMKR